ncbi:MAG: DUF3080 domain-containing protein, partial [Gammaproteobacteria bacterium]|nr:DUF3080 domain-containing protein [Gammaproteobacteria bacterium]
MAASRFVRMVVVCLLPAACSNAGPEAMLQDYLQRVTRVLELQVDPATFVVQLSPFPARRDLRLPLPEVRIGMFDFLSLRQCELHSVVAERNSSLGRVMVDSQRLVYERRFLAAARVCLTQLDPEADADMMDQLGQIIDVKIAALPNAVWNASLAGREFAHHMSLSGPSLPAQDAPLPDAGAPLNGLAHALAADPPDGMQLERALQAVQSERSGGALLRSAAALIRYLEATATALETRRERGPVCPQGRPTARARTLNTVFMKFYVGQVQPYLSRVHRHSRSWLAAIHGLRTVQPVDEPESFAAYAKLSLSASQGLWRRFDAAIERHTQAWQDLLKQCDLMP